MKTRSMLTYTISVVTREGYLTGLQVELHNGEYQIRAESDGGNWAIFDTQEEAARVADMLERQAYKEGKTDMRFNVLVEPLSKP